MPELTVANFMRDGLPDLLWDIRAIVVWENIGGGVTTGNKQQRWKVGRHLSGDVLLHL